MKRVLIICAAIMMVCAFFTTQAVAQQMQEKYDITANYGKLVSWTADIGGPGKGFPVDHCEQVGSISIAPQSNNDNFNAGQIIIAELLNDAFLCKDVGYDYDGDGLLEPVRYRWNGDVLADNTAAWDYRVRGVSTSSILAGFPNPTIWDTLDASYPLISTGFVLNQVFQPDKIIIEVNNGSNDPALFIRIGHEIVADILLANPNITNINQVPNSILCFNLHGTEYKPTDPLYSLVQVSYHDQFFNTYSGDQYVATVKKATEVSGISFDVETCAKLEGQPFPDGVGALGWPDSVDVKSGKLQIPLCYSDIQNPQEQVECGCKIATQEVCFKVTPEAPFDANSNYHFTIITDKTGVGIDNVKVYGADLQVPIYDNNFVNECLNQRVEFDVTLPELRTYYVVVRPAFDCPAQPGPWLLDLVISRNVLGCEMGQQTWSEDNIYGADFVDCEGNEATTNRVFPYSPAFNTGWWEGIVLTNPNDAQITVTMAIYEADGDKYTANLIVPAKGLIVGLLDNVAFFNPQADGTDATFGDEPFWMVGESTLPFYGFYMVGDGTQAQGYLPYNPLKF
ncbi:MAG: hypothetical protein GY749_44010 [Desulfobacteraceae bacterium]|nr:hypothetical protein [Desulfobacteraceae bacterium]